MLGAEILEKVRARDPDQKEFLQAVEEVIESLGPLFAAHPKYLNVSNNPKGIHKLYVWPKKLP